MVACTSNKCLHGLPGTSFVLLSPEGAARAADAPRRSLYLDIAGYLEAQKKSTVPFTPAVPAVYGLEAALDELLDEGPVSYTHLRAHETDSYLVCRLLLEK